MSLIGTKAEGKCTVNGQTVGVDELIETEIIDLETANRCFYYLWELYFSSTREPDNWEYMYGEISSQVSAFKILLDRITDNLLAVYGMASDYHAAQLAILSSNAMPQTNTQNHPTH